ncbi:MAG: hypothetical protein DRG82_17425, partial [Deltaproteobacteria bacterium]
MPSRDNVVIFADGNTIIFLVTLSNEVKMFKTATFISLFVLATAASSLYPQEQTLRDTVYELPPVVIVGKAIVEGIQIRNNATVVT